MVVRARHTQAEEPRGYPVDEERIKHAGRDECSEEAVAGYVFSPKAARSGAASGTRQTQVIDALRVPPWYWWLVAALTVGLGAVVDRLVDTHHPALLALAAPLYAVLVAGTTGWLIVGRHRARGSSVLLGEWGVVALVGFVWLLIGVSLGVGFGLRTAGVGQPATLACLVCALGLIAGGPALLRYVRHTRRTRRAV